MKHHARHSLSLCVWVSVCLCVPLFVRSKMLTTTATRTPLTLHGFGSECSPFVCMCVTTSHSNYSHRVLQNVMKPSKITFFFLLDKSNSVKFSVFDLQNVISLFFHSFLKFFHLEFCFLLQLKSDSSLAEKHPVWKSLSLSLCDEQDNPWAYTSMHNQIYIWIFDEQRLLWLWWQRIELPWTCIYTRCIHTSNRRNADIKMLCIWLSYSITLVYERETNVVTQQSSFVAAVNQKQYSKHTIFRPFFIE